MPTRDNQLNPERPEVQEANSRLWIVHENVQSLLQNPSVIEGENLEAIEQQNLSTAVRQSVEVDHVAEPQPTNVVDIDAYRPESLETDPVAQALQGVEDAFADSDSGINMDLEDPESGIGLVA